MSEVETAVDGAQVAPVVSETPAATQAPNPTTEQDTPQDDNPQARDEKGRFQQRVNEITRARREAERERDYWRQQAETRHHAAAQQSGPQGNEAPPSLEDYGYDMGKWSAAVVDHASRTAEARVAQQFQQQSYRQQQQTVEQEFEQRSQEYAKAHPDFDQAVDTLSRSVQFHPAIVEAIGLSAHGPAVVHYLAQHLDEADRIARLPAHIAAVQLGRLEAQLAMPRSKPVTNAPNPTPTVSGGSAARPGIKDGMSYEQYRAARMGKS